MSDNPYTIYILSRGRPNHVKTINQSLKPQGYTGPWFIVLDNEDETRSEYEANFGADRVLVFDKRAVMNSIDMGDNFGLAGSVVPRAAIWKIARERGDKYFIMLDDDYEYFDWRFDEHNRTPPHTYVKNLDKAFQILVDYYAEMPETVLTLAMLQHGDFIGGKQGSRLEKICAFRKAMNFFICSTERPFTFPGRLNEDVNAYTEIQRRGYVFMSVNRIALQQSPTQGTAGGLTDLYRTHGTYVKTFYSVMRCPSGVKVWVLADRNVDPRIHHRVSYNYVAPRILSDRWRKART